MKKWIIITIMALMSMTILSYAEESIKSFEVLYEDDGFELILSENASTGYQWVYELSDKNNMVLLSDENRALNPGLLGSPTQRVLNFKVLQDGVYTISLKKERSFEDNGPIESLELLIYKNENKLIVEENQILTIMDGKKAEYQLIIRDQVLDLDVEIKQEDQVTMVPVALALRALDYEVLWHGERQTVEIKKGNQWTEIKIGENAYFKNKMAASPLSKAPIIVEGRTLVPLEFFKEILDLSFKVENQQLIFTDQVMGTYAGRILAMDLDEDGKGQIRISLGVDKVSDDFLKDQLVLNVSNDHTFIQGNLKVGDVITAHTSMIQTKSLPPQTPAYLIFKRNISDF